MFVLASVANMDTEIEVAERSPLSPVLALLLSIGLVRAAGRVFGLVALLVIVIACVGAFAIGIVVLRLALMH